MTVHDDYYFVPFGRDPGGLLDVLGLSPEASAADVEDALGKYRKHIDNEMRAERKAQRERRDKGDITPEEFERIRDELMHQADARTARLNELKEPYDGQIAERRRLRQKGIQVREDVLWQQMYPVTSDTASLFRLLKGLQQSPLCQLSEDQLQERITPWFSAGKLIVQDDSGNSPGLAWSALGLVSDETRDHADVFDLFDLVCRSYLEDHSSNPDQLDLATRRIETERELLTDLLDSMQTFKARIFRELNLTPDTPGPELQRALIRRQNDVFRRIESIAEKQLRSLSKNESAGAAREKLQQECLAAKAAWSTYFESLLAEWKQEARAQPSRDTTRPFQLSARIDSYLADHESAYSVLSDSSIAGRMVNLVRDAKLLTLLTADALWSQLVGTNRSYWRKELETFRKSMSSRREGAATDVPVSASPFAQDRHGYVAVLPWGEIEESSGPDRGASFGRGESMLADLLARLGINDEGDPADGEQSKTPLEQFRARLGAILGRGLTDG